MRTERTTGTEPSTATAIERRIDRVMQGLKASLATLLDDLPGGRGRLPITAVRNGRGAGRISWARKERTT